MVRTAPPCRAGEQDTGLADEQWLDAQAGQFERVLASGQFPQLARIFQTPRVDLDMDTLFEFGLNRLFDGYTALIERHTSPSV